MKPKRNANAGYRLAGLLIASLSLAGPLSPIRAHDSAVGAGCDSYDLDINTELNLLAGERSAVAAATTSAGPVPALAPGTAYLLRLAPQAGVRFVASPQRRLLDEGAFAGFVTFTVPVAGTWRIGLGDNSWVDLVAQDGSLVPSSRFGGRPGCETLRKLVEFPLEANTAYTLQVSGGTEPTLPVVLSGPIVSGP